MKTISPTIYDILDLIIYEQVNETGPLHQAMLKRGYTSGQFKSAYHNTLISRWGAVEDMQTREQALKNRKQYQRDAYYRRKIVPEQLFIHLGSEWEDRLWMKHKGWKDWDRPREEILHRLERDGDLKDQQFEVMVWENADQTVAALRVRWLLDAYPSRYEYFIVDGKDWLQVDFDELPKKAQRELRKLGRVN